MLERISLPAPLPPVAPVASPTPMPQAGAKEVSLDSVSLGTGVDDAPATPGAASSAVGVPSAAGVSGTRQVGLLQGLGITALVSSTLSQGVPGLYAAPLLVASSQGREQEARRLVDAMVTSPIGFLQRRVLVGAALDFGLDNMKRVLDGGVRLEMAEDNPFSEIRTSMCATYTPDRKLLRFPPARLDNATVLHELGHALDDVIEPDEADHAVLRSHRDEKLQAMYHDYCERVEGLSFWQRLLHRGLWSDYATTSPQEYVAEGVMDYTRSDSTRRRLERNDPALSAYVHDLLTP